MKGSKSSLKKFTSVFSVAIFCLLISAGCATKEAVKKMSDEDMLRKRVMLYWDYKIKGEYDKMYAFEDPFTRKKIVLQKYLQLYNNPMIEFRGYEISGIGPIKEAAAEVDVKARMWIKIPGTKALEYDTGLTEQWFQEAGEWYHIHGLGKSGAYPVKE